jgi:hypothetical protein
MPIFPAVLAGGVATAIVAGMASGAMQIVLKVLAGLGMGYVAYQGADLLVTQNEEQVLLLISTFPPLVVTVLGVLKVGVCLKIVFSAMIMRLTIFGLNQSVIRRMVVTGPQGG